MASPRVLLVDIETSPILAHVWALFDQQVAINQIARDWHILSYAAKWLDEEEMFYEDQRNAKNIEDDSKILKGIWALMDEADIIVSQNGTRFDIKKLHARFIMNGMKPPSSFKQIDTLALAKKHFAFTSNKLEWMGDKLCTKYKKLKHEDFHGFELWKECLAGNKKAWAVMEKYNRHDVLATEELYHRLIPWDNSVNFNLYKEGLENTCKCGSEWNKNGSFYTSSGKYQRYRCPGCGAEHRGKENLLSKDKKKALRK